MLTCTTSLILVGVMIVVWQWFGLRQSMVHNLSTQAKVIADNCKASIAFEEPQDSYDVLQSLKSEPTIVFGGVYNVDGQIWLESEVGQGTTFFFTFPKSKIKVPDYEESITGSAELAS